MYMFMDSDAVLTLLLFVHVVNTHTVSPSYGPEAGGTVLTIRNCDTPLETKEANTTMVVNANCSLISITTTSMTCLTPPRNMTSYPLEEDIAIQLPADPSSAASKQTVGYFRYTENPVIEGIEPKFTIVSGGTSVTVSGENLESVESPRLVVHSTHRNETITRKSQPCRVENKTGSVVYICNPPPLLAVSSTTRTYSLGLDLNADLPYVDLQQVLPEAAGFTVHQNPTIYPFPGKKQIKHYEPSIIIQGSNLLRGGPTKADYSVSVNKVNCNITAVTNTEIQCKPPVTKPSMELSQHAEVFRTTEEHLAEVYVMIGSEHWNYNKFVGFLSYEEVYTFGIPGMGTALFILVLMVVVVMLVACLTKFCQPFYLENLYG